MTGNPAFPTLQASLAPITAAATVLREAIAASLDGGKLAVATRRARQRELKDLLDRLAEGVANVAGKEEEVVLSSGFGVRRASTPLAEPGMPRNLSARISEHEGRVDLTWTPVPEALTYHILHHASDPLAVDGWVLVGVSTRAAFFVKGLTSGKLAHFKVAGVGTRGMGPWSQVASSLVR
ncbi:MAG: fibronectin type III domain-containing protein [Flavobacteriales bacterium]